MRAAAITLVTALHQVDADRVAARISDGHRMHVAGSAFATARAVADRADQLDRVCGPDAGHGLVVTLHPGADARAVGMLLANAARSETGDDRVLRHVVGVLRPTTSRTCCGRTSTTPSWPRTGWPHSSSTRR